MAVTAEQVHAQIDAVVKVLENLSARERETKPSITFVENYNSLLALAAGVMPDVDSRRWPPNGSLNQSATDQPNSDVRFTEIHAFYKQIQVILGEFSQDGLYTTHTI